MNERYAVVTGATQGIGRAIAEKLLSEGFHIALCARTQQGLDHLREEWRQRWPGAQVLALRADFSRQEDVLRFAQELVQAVPRVDVLVNNAGTFRPGELASEPNGMLEEMMRVNLFGAYDLTRALLPHMEAGGHIFNICSVASLKAYPNGGAYSITKYALLGFSENLRHELMPRRIRVTALCPGATRSRSWSGTGVPRERIMEATDVAEILWAAYSLSEKADVEKIVMRPIAGDL